jgi:hypothetical protein
MDDAEIANAELDRYLATRVERLKTALVEAEQQLHDWRHTGTPTRHDLIEAWKHTAVYALQQARDGQDPLAAVERVQALRRWLVAEHYWSEDDEIPAEVEIALRKALRAARA